jgi:hypothetical protein
MYSELERAGKETEMTWHHICLQIQKNYEKPYIKKTDDLA